MIVQTVTGPIDSSEQGLVLPHEHLHNDASTAYSEAADPALAQLLSGPVSADRAWLLHDNPYHSADNCRVDDAAAVLDDLKVFADNGGTTVVDLTPPGIGRRPEILEHYSRESGVRVVMGSGWYLEPTHPPEVTALGIDNLAARLIAEFTGDGPRPGVIGEIGVSPSFTDAEAKALRAACIAQRETYVPLFVHLPGWQRRGHQVLDIVVDEMGVDPAAVVLCHMDPSGDDPDYQCALADRGVFLEFDMIGMPFEFAGEGQSPSPADTAFAICGLVGGGYRSQLLLSHDLFLKSMLRKFGGNGLAYVPVSFAARLVRSGMDAHHVSSLMQDNPRSLFESAGKG